MPSHEATEGAARNLEANCAADGKARSATTIRWRGESGLERVIIRLGESVGKLAGWQGWGRRDGGEWSSRGAQARAA